MCSTRSSQPASEIDINSGIPRIGRRVHSVLNRVAEVSSSEFSYVSAMTKVSRQSQGGMKFNGACAAIYLSAVLLSSMSLEITVEGAPILGPDLGSCRPVIPPKRTAADAVDCCFVETGGPIKDFEFDFKLPVRVRKPVHKLDEEFVRKYERAVELMRALPAHDPRSYESQSKIHCAYCAAAYSQANSSETFDVHHGWLVLPFHRWYMYFHERILASLIGDDSFAIPYWAWDVQNESSPPANVIPAIFTNSSSPLFDLARSKVHQPPSIADLCFQESSGEKDPAVLKLENFNTLWRTMVGDVRTPEAFYGGKFAQGYSVSLRDGVFEAGPHASVHFWTGDESAPFGEDMAPAYSSARDPLFFAHHSQVDRLWLMWKSFGGPDLDDPDWLDTEFLFYDENADMVRVNIRDSLDFERFRISYDQVNIDWLKFAPKSIRETDPSYARSGLVSQIWHGLRRWDVARDTAIAVEGLFRGEKVGPALLLGEPGRAVVSSRVPRPKMVRSANISAAYDEVLLVRGTVEKPFNISVHIKMYLELPEATESTPHSCVEFLGVVKLDSEGLGVGQNTRIAREFSRTIGITDRLHILDVGSQVFVTVTFVPAWDPLYDADVSVRITDLKVKMKLIS